MCAHRNKVRGLDRKGWTLDNWAHSFLEIKMRMIEEKILKLLPRNGNRFIVISKNIIPGFFPKTKQTKNQETKALPTMQMMKTIED
uniref:Uncharacterized protein n=1 Tax=Romanomermis culicivorax TaxID=13658 RepID=A0A915J4U9_ROMCU